MILCPPATVRKIVTIDEYQELEATAAKIGMTTEGLIDVLLAQEMARAMVDWRDRILIGTRH